MALYRRFVTRAAFLARQNYPLLWRHRGGAGSLTAFAAAGIVDGEFHLLSDFKAVELLVGHSRVMEENVGSIASADESKSLVLNELFDSAGRHANHSTGRQSSKMQADGVRPNSPDLRPRPVSCGKTYPLEAHAATNAQSMTSERPQVPRLLTLF
jgi:hypothetical protein